MSERSLRLAVATDHPAYAGHFPGDPILPGVVLLDAALWALAAESGRPAAAARIKSAKFHSPVRPGEILSLHFTEPTAGDVRFEIRCDARSVASGSVAFAQSA
jgi:3-hydroxymyristoyl/3-hydroxydecanoyl-(acyl carrier protein) dehydratase